MPRIQIHLSSIMPALVTLSACADILTLNRQLIATLGQMAPGLQARVYERSQAGSDWRLAACTGEGEGVDIRIEVMTRNRDLEWIAALRNSVSEPTAVTHGADKSVSVVPIRRGGELLGAMILEGRSALYWTEALAPVVRVYVNLFGTLHRGSHDPLTGLLNRQTFDDRMAAIVDESLREHRALDEVTANSFFVILDIDHFKQVNDTYGHQIGDEVLLRFSQLLARSMRSGDLLFRFGGEEFVVILDGVDHERAAKVLERFREMVATYGFPQVGGVTVSIGYTRLDISRSTDVVAERADQALYYAKEQGRNQVHCFEQLVAAGEIVPAELTGGSVDLF